LVSDEDRIEVSNMALETGEVVVVFFEVLLLNSSRSVGIRNPKARALPPTTPAMAITARIRSPVIFTPSLRCSAGRAGSGAFFMFPPVWSRGDGSAVSSSGGPIPHSGTGKKWSGEALERYG